MNEQERRKEKLKEYLESEDYSKKLIDRLKIGDACNRSNTAKAYAVAACRADPVFFFNNFCWTPNDKYKQYHFPFILFPFQEDLMEWLQVQINEGKDGFMDKSREMGATWGILTLFLWYWLFSDNFNALIGSHKQDKVDDRTKDSLFGMLDYQLQNLPRWMLPKRFSLKKHRTMMKLINPENQNLIKGDTMNPEFGRGSRRTVVFLDEGAYWEYFQDAWTAIGDVTNCRLTVSTPKGYNAFAMLKEVVKDQKTLHWRSHPLKDQQWYDFEKERRSPEEMAQEIDISYQKSQVGRVYPEWDNIEIGNFPYIPEFPLYVSWDFGRTDDTAIIWWQKDIESGKVRVIDCYWNNGKTIDFYVPFINGMIASDGYVYTDRDLKVIEAHKGWRMGTHFGDPAGRFTNQVVNATVLSVLKDNGIHVNFRDSWKEFSERIPASKLIIRDGFYLNENSRTKYLNVCMINSQYTEVQRGGTTVINSIKQKPKHDQYSHLRSSFEYGALGIAMQLGRSNRVYDKFKPRERATRSISY